MASRLINSNLFTFSSLCELIELIDLIKSVWNSNDIEMFKSRYLLQVDINCRAQISGSWVEHRCCFSCEFTLIQCIKPLYFNFIQPTTTSQPPTHRLTSTKWVTRKVCTIVINSKIFSWKLTLDCVFCIAGKKKNNILPHFGNDSMNLNPLILTNIQSSVYFKGEYQCQFADRFQLVTSI